MPQRLRVLGRNDLAREALAHAVRAQLDVAAHAALSSVCLAILNLDEALTRE
jgi:hypothetical protein